MANHILLHMLFTFTHFTTTFYLSGANLSAVLLSAFFHFFLLILLLLLPLPLPCCCAQVLPSSRNDPLCPSSHIVSYHSIYIP